MKRLATVSAATLIALAAPAFAQTPDQAAADQAASKSKSQRDPNKVVCHDEGETGSRLSSHRECHTVAQWQDLQRQQRADMQAAQGGTGR